MIPDANLKSILTLTCNELRNSINVARDGVLTKYGREHYAVKRLDEYYPILDKQLEYINMIDDLVKDENYEDLMLLSSKIKAMAEMIKKDASELVDEFHNGVNRKPDKNTWN